MSEILKSHVSRSYVSPLPFEVFSKTEPYRNLIGRMKLMHAVNPGSKFSRIGCQIKGLGAKERSAEVQGLTLRKQKIWKNL